MAYLTSKEAYDAYQNMKYKESQRVMDAYIKQQEQEKNRPGEYTSQYGKQIQDKLAAILNREKFSYDMNADPIYNQYKNNYVKQGQLAMLDATAAASAQTGGYGNSYAASVGNQMYQSHLSQLNDVVPQLYNQAYQMYQNQGNDMYNQLSALQGQDQVDYGKYRDKVSDYYTNRNYYTDLYNSLYSQDYAQFSDERNNAYNAGNALFSAEQAAQAQQNWEREMALNQYKANANSSKNDLPDAKQMFTEYQDATGSPNPTTVNEFRKSLEWIYNKYGFEGYRTALTTVEGDGVLLSQQNMESLKQSMENYIDKKNK